MATLQNAPSKLSVIDSIGLGWSLAFIGEDQASKLGTLASDLKRGFSTTGDGKQIASGFSYWGIGPTVAWIVACKDALYPVMNESTKHFADLWRVVIQRLDDANYHYVSLGLGTGEKDNVIIPELLRRDPTFHYFPVDMSQEMLRLGTREAIRGIGINRTATLPVQIDFSVDANVRELRHLLDTVLGDEPILFSLLGNTLSNFNADTDLLETLARLIRPRDRLLLEVATTDSLGEEAYRDAAAEYDRSRLFKEFVTSSLFQNTDLAVDLDSVTFDGSAESDRAILIKTIYRNTVGTPLPMTLPDRSRTSFRSDDTIRLSTMRKYTARGIDSLTAECGFTVLSKVPMFFAPRRRQFRFGTTLLLLMPGPSGEPTRRSYRWDIFIAHAGPDGELAERLYDSLLPSCRPFVDRKCLQLGDDWDTSLSEAQRSSMITVVLISSRTEKAYYQREEIAASLAMAREDGDRHRVVPVVLDDGGNDDIVPLGLRLKHGLRIGPNMTLDDVAARLRDLVTAVKSQQR
jgi:L-histidine N-alpha-methyltransferase